MNLYSLTIHELHEKLKNKEISSVGLTEEISLFFSFWWSSWMVRE